MSWLVRTAPMVLALLWLAPVRAEDVPPGSRIAWSKDLPTAFAKAKEDRKVIMICVNARHVAGRKSEEPAAKGLREVVYKDARVVGKSRELVCVLLTREGSAKDYGELRALGIDGDIVSPQHIFVHPDGQKILVRAAYWSHGAGEEGVNALLAMMDNALQKWTTASESPEASDANEPPADAKGRLAWIERMVRQVVDGNANQFEAALDTLVKNDQDGDCTGPVIELLSEHKKNIPLIVAIIRALGRDGLTSAAPGIADQLGHKEMSVRGNAAVSLEYIGSREKGVVSALKKAAGREKDEGIANHVYRALGRCGVKDAKARALLLKKAGGAKSEFASYGPTIGLAYFEGDEKAARGVESLLKKIGVPGGKRGGGQNTVKRGVLSWTLAVIGDKKSGTFVREELLEKLKNVQAFWVEGLRGFYRAVAQKCDGDDGAMAGIEQGVRAFVGYAKRFDLGRYGAETRNLMDEYRTGRDTTAFKPKGDNLLGGGS